jgi:hypothetical protein
MTSRPADITDTDRFRKLGVSLAANPDGELTRTLVSARIVLGADGIKRTELVTSGPADRVLSSPTLFDGADLRTQLVDMVLGSPAVPPAGISAPPSRRSWRRSSMASARGR